MNQKSKHKSNRISNRISKRKSIIGVSFFSGSIVKGYITLKQDKDQPQIGIIQANISGLEPNQKYAWHIHEAGDLRPNRKTKKKCEGACAHYNPHNKTHGGLKSKDRHVGDLGNLRTNSRGESHTRIRVPLNLHGKYSVIGRSIVIHAKEDDLGLGGTEESLKTGSAGARIACAVIGYAKNSQLYF